MRFDNSRLIHAAVLQLLLVCSLFTQAQEGEETSNPASAAIAAPNPLQALFDAEQQQGLTWLGDKNAFIGRYSPATTPFQMAILGLYKNADRLDEPAVLNALHNTLPLQGWQVLSLLLPLSPASDTDTEQPNQEGNELDRCYRGYCCH